FIGGAIAKSLASEHEILAMSRSEKSDVPIWALGAEPVRCDLATLEPGDIPDCDAVIHCAAYVESWGTRELTWKINVEGTERTLKAARAAGAKRFLHMGTEAVLWKGQDLVDVDESYPYPESTPYLYSETKAEAERLVIAANESGGMETVVLRPRFVWGPGDQTLAPEITAMVEKGAFMWVDGGRARTSTTHIDNLVHGAKLVLERGRGGEAYFVTDGEVRSFREFLPALMSAYEVELGDKSMPSAIVRPIARLVEAIWRTFKLSSTPPITRHAIDLMCCDCTLRIDKIESELGYHPVLSVEEGLLQLREAMLH
ncbi:MAG: NAD-dependent epimerase/dehydratase family protein, partial [Proteobacteria bacterium]|nr:NAD-dependent epimerase/dehydratase family protein [Pseudomonadota bacterium]